MAGRAKESLPGGSLKYLLVYLKVRIFKCSYRSYASLPEGMSWKFVWNIDMNVIGPISGLLST